MRLLLVGCGHAHLFVLEALARGRLAGVSATLVSPSDEYYYSGMIPGVVAGCYPPGTARFRPPHLARAAGAEWSRDRVTRIDPARQRVRLGSGAELAYDVLSLDIGSRMVGDDVPGVAQHAIPTKPMRQALELVPRAEARVARADSRRPARILVVGGGAAGIEMSLCLNARLTARFGRDCHRITILEAGDRILTEHAPTFRTRAAALLGERGIVVRSGTRVEMAAANQVTTAEGEALACDLLLWATGPRAPALPRDSGLPTDDRGYLLVESTLRAADHPDIFGAGDCITLASDRWVPKAGVYAVREGPVLAANLERLLDGKPLQEYRPQRDWLSLMNTGDGRALLHYRQRSLRGRAAWWLKDRIDRRFMRRFQRLEG
jgi:pyridine nucleotide-disulfide oxidoreductase family protein